MRQVIHTRDETTCSESDNPDCVVGGSTTETSSVSIALMVTDPQRQMNMKIEREVNAFKSWPPPPGSSVTCIVGKFRIGHDGLLRVAFPSFGVSSHLSSPSIHAISLINISFLAQLVERVTSRRFAYVSAHKMTRSVVQIG